MNIQEELKKLEAIMTDGLTAENMAQIEQIFDCYRNDHSPIVDP